VSNGNIEEMGDAIKLKNNSISILCEKFKSETVSEDDIMLVIRSVGDNNSFIAANAENITKVINFLDRHFEPNNPTDSTNLSIRFGRNGSRLSHDHKTQYHYVKQSLMLWREIMQDMFRLWHLSEEDLLDPGNSYHLSDTGQGLNRVQSAPRVGRAMSKILKKVYKLVPGNWVGLSAVHLGDRDVPNALIFIDKYSQVPRIINPLVKVIEEIDRLDEKNFLIFLNTFKKDGEAKLN